ncbi:MAG: four helix bundle protein [Bacteroidaceae bacterium]|nr:four helix bundle protein [Bacteroidaceae bacterium]
MTNSFKDIVAWQKAHQLVLNVYKATANFPEYEKFSLASQFQRAVVSIPANIAEGYRKDGIGDKLRFLNISQGSLEECRYYVILSKDLGYISEDLYNNLTENIEETSKLLNAYYAAIRANHGK